MIALKHTILLINAAMEELSKQFSFMKLLLFFVLLLTMCLNYLLLIVVTFIQFFLLVNLTPPIS